MHNLPFKYNYNDVDILKALSKTNHKIGELKGIINLISNHNIILGVTKESSEIENIFTAFNEISLKNYRTKQVDNK